MSLEYVKYFNLFGKEVAQVPSILGNGKPEDQINNTLVQKAEPGCLYMDRLSGDLYKQIEPGQWKIVGGGVRTVNGITPDENGNVDASYIIQIYYDGDSDTFQFMEEFDWNALEEKVTAGVPVFLHVYDSTPEPDVPVRSLLLHTFDREDRIAVFSQFRYSYGTLRTEEFTIYGDGTIERKITNVPMDNTVIVTVDGSKASHTAKQIQNSMTDGATVLLLKDDKYCTLSHYDGDAYFVEIDDAGVLFIHRVYADGRYELFQINNATKDDLNNAMSKTVKSVNGVTPDENGLIDLQFIIPVTELYDESGTIATYTLDETFNWDAMVNAIQSGKYVACRDVYTSEDASHRLEYPMASAFLEDGYVVFSLINEEGNAHNLTIFQRGDNNEPQINFEVFRRCEVDAGLSRAGFAADAAVVGEQLKNRVKTVNGTAPDENGNVQIETGGSNDLANITELYTSPNLLNPETVTLNAGMSANGTIYTNRTHMGLTDYIPVSVGDVLTYQGANYYYGDRRLLNIRWVAAFDENKNVLTAKGSNADLTSYTVPEGVAFVRLSLTEYVRNSDNSVVNGTELIDYEPYGTWERVKNSAINYEPIKEYVNSAVAPKGRAIALPAKFYAFVNQPISIYFRNILDYNLNTVYVRQYLSNIGRQYADRWEHTPEVATTINGSVRVYDDNYAELNNQAFQIMVKDKTQKESLSVLVIGDSTVAANYETQKMLDLASTDGYPLTLLGTQGNAPNLHEGRGGWKAESYVSNINSPFYNPETETFDFSYYMTQQGYSRVDCVFIQLGINDVFGAWAIDRDSYINTYIKNMETIVNGIRSYDSNIKIVINMIIPCGDDQDVFSSFYPNKTTWNCKKNTYEANIKLLNKFYGATNVFVSPYNSAIDAVNNLKGDVHPNEAGYAQLGTQMYYYMRAIN